MREFTSTRRNDERVSASKAIIKGLADDKGLYVPTEIPSLEECGIDLEDLRSMSYQDVAKRVIGTFFDNFTEDEIENAVLRAYDSKFDTEDIVPVVRAGKGFFLELYHGPTSAFKDMALSILPHLLTTSVKKEGETNKICILTATSGDTGKAALAGFADVEGTEIIVFYPNGGVSEVQKAQMITQEGENTHVFAIEGNFDDAQTGVKRIFNDTGFNQELLRNGIRLSSANSINIGRLIPQVAYYVYGYGRLASSGDIKPGDPINVVVPTGNFGNILAAYYARNMGLPIDKLICASNVNKVLTDFINTGLYDARREFHLTNSPSMDILISSNLERLLYHLSGESKDVIDDLMRRLDEDKHYEVGREIKEGLKLFYGGFASVEETNGAIRDMYEENGYLMDTHTAVAYKVYKDYIGETGDQTPTLIASTASPYKFTRSVAEAIGLEECENDFRYLDELSQVTGIAIPEGLRDLDKKEIRHNEVIEIAEMGDAVRRALSK